MHEHNEPCSHEHENTAPEHLELPAEAPEAEDDYVPPGRLRQIYNFVGFNIMKYGQAAAFQVEMAAVCPCPTCVGTGLGATALTKFTGKARAFRHKIYGEPEEILEAEIIPFPVRPSSDLQTRLYDA